MLSLRLQHRHFDQLHTRSFVRRSIAMSTKELLSLWTFVAVVVLVYKYYTFSNTQEQMFLGEFSNVRGSRSLKMENSKSEITLCMGRRCVVAFDQNKSNIDVLISSVILSLIGLAIYLTVMLYLRAAGPSTRKPNRKAKTLAEAFKRTSHSTSIGFSSLSPSPVPRKETLFVQDRQSSHKTHSKIPWDRIAKSSDYEVCLSLHPSPLPSPVSSFTATSNIDSNSDGPSGLYLCAPPKRWRNNSKLNLATSPEVVPHKVDQYYRL